MVELGPVLFLLAVLLACLSLGMWIFVALALASFIGFAVLLGYPPTRIGDTMARVLIRSSTSWELASVPMFMLMGELVFRSDISDRLFRGLAPIAKFAPGRLLHTNVLGCAMFAAISGSSTATTVTVGKISLVELFRRGYDRDIAVGSLAGAGSLGLLIPPSIVMIVYGILAEVSIVKLFSAGLIPGLMMAALYSLYIMATAWRRPTICPPATYDGDDLSLSALLGLLPTLGLILIVLGSLYAGLASPSEAAAVGVVATLILLVFERQLTFKIISDSLMGTVAMSSMVIGLVVAAATLANVMGFLHIPQQLAGYIAGLQLSPHALILTLCAFYIVLGFFLEGVSITVMTLPIVLPLITQAGFDPIWFGVFLVVMVELATITPPVGFNLFIIQGLTNFSLGRVAHASFPFFLLMCLGVVLMYVFPEIVLWLPSKMH